MRTKAPHGEGWISRQPRRPVAPARFKTGPAVARPPHQVDHQAPSEPPPTPPAPWPCGARAAPLRPPAHPLRWQRANPQTTPSAPPRPARRPASPVPVSTTPEARKSTHRPRSVAALRSRTRRYDSTTPQRSHWRHLLIPSSSNARQTSHTWSPPGQTSCTPLSRRPPGAETTAPNARRARRCSFPA